MIRKIKNLEMIPENSIIVTLDDRSLYTNIPNNEGIKAVETTLKQKKLQQELSLHFSTKQFHFQLPELLTYKGYAIGTKCAPSYASIFMIIFEDKFVYPLVNNMTRLYLRFIVNIFMNLRI